MCQPDTPLKIRTRTSLVVQWLRIRLPTQGTWVRVLVREDPTWHGATKPMCRNYWACALQPTCHNYWAHVLQRLKPTHLEPVLRKRRGHCTTMKSSPCSPQLEKARAQQRRPNTAKKKKIRTNHIRESLCQQHCYCDVSGAVLATSQHSILTLSEVGSVILPTLQMKKLRRERDFR